MRTFSKGQKKIAEFIKENYDKAAFMTAAKLGQAVGVSESTVVRFVIEFGFEGYPDFQRALKDMVRTNLTSVQRVAVTNSLIGDSNVLDKVLYSDMEKIKRTADGIDKLSFENAVKNISRAKNIYIIGVRALPTLRDF